MSDKLEWLQGKGEVILSSKPQRYSGVWGTIDVEYKITREGDWIDNAYWITGREVPKTMSMTHVEHATLSAIVEEVKKDFQKQHEEFLELFSKGYEPYDENLICVPRGIGFEDELIRLVKVIYGDDSDARDLIDEHVFETFELRPDYEDNSKPNFHYKPTDLQISWYKYPLRSASCNREITLDEFAKVIDKCIEAYKLESKQGAQR